MLIEMPNLTPFGILTPTMGSSAEIMHSKETLSMVTVNPTPQSWL